MNFITSLLASVLRPIIREQFEELKVFLANQWVRREAFRRYDQEATELMEQMANASTSEERWAILARIKKSRPTELM